MQPEDVKKQIKSILGQDINFEGHFNLVIESMKDNLVKGMLGWIKNCKEGKELFTTSIKTKGLIAFFFKPNDNRYRGILTKEKNSYFLSLFLDKHKYYERERRKLRV